MDCHPVIVCLSLERLELDCLQLQSGAPRLLGCSQTLQLVSGFNLPGVDRVRHLLVLLPRPVRERVLLLHPLRPAWTSHLAVDQVHSLAKGPDSRSSGLDARGMLEPDLLLTGNSVDFDSEPRVVHHTHEIPCWHGGHAILAVVPSSDADLRSARKGCDRNFEMPEDPTPPLAKLRRLLEGIEGSHAPVLAAVQGYFHTVHRSASTVVCISLQTVRVSVGQRDFCGVIGLPTDTLQVPIIDAIQRIHPDVLLGCDIFTHNVRWKNTVVVLVVEGVGFLVRYNDLAQPLNHPSANVPRNEESHWEAMIWMQELPIV
mmetsp:Transcript_109649/g.224044  ORF Transcript_109649/g.224044 Transcript_109649/m.224044 type:complete len:315 (-) Transcript_109649:461-1405(-)